MPATVCPPDDKTDSFPSLPTLRGGVTSRSGESVLGRIDHYDLLKKLGGGGFGVVYLARDTVSGVEVALKTLHPLLKSNAEEMDALREKFALVSRLTHTNIAKPLVLHRVLDLNIWDETARQEMRLSPGDSVMVMDYAPGATLSRWRRQFPGGIVPTDLALEIARQVAFALDYAHGERIVHRDIKPGNVMVETLAAPEPPQASDHGNGRARPPGAPQTGGASRPGEPPLVTRHPSLVSSRIRVRILDFGLAAEIRSSMSRVSNETGDTSGTRPYMAPEQWLGRKQDGRTDQYALACVLYEMLSGAPPFAGVFETGDPDVMMAMVEKRAPEPVSGHQRTANAALLRALAKDPAARFPNCTAFVEALSRGLGGGRLAGTARTTTRWIAAAVAVAVAGLAALWFTRSRPGSAVILPAEESHAESAESAESMPPPASTPESHAESAESAESVSSPPASAPESPAGNAGLSGGADTSADSGSHREPPKTVSPPWDTERPSAGESRQLASMILDCIPDDPGFSAVYGEWKKHGGSATLPLVEFKPFVDLTFRAGGASAGTGRGRSDGRKTRAIVDALAKGLLEKRIFRVTSRFDASANADVPDTPDLLVSGSLSCDTKDGEITYRLQVSFADAATGETIWMKSVSLPLQQETGPNP